MPEGTGVAGGDGRGAGGDGGVSSAAGGDGVAASGDHFDAHGRDPGRVGGRVGGVLEVVAGADRPGALGQGQPVALAGLAAEEDLEAAVGVDVERGVVEYSYDLVVHRPPRGAGLHRDRHVGGGLRLAGHPVGVIGGDGGVEVDGVGVVAQQLSVRGDDAMEPGSGRVALEQSDQAPLQVVHQGPVRADNIVGGVQIPFRRCPAPVGLAQQVDQLVQGPAGFGLYGVQGLFTHRPHLRRISVELCAVWTQHPHQESAGGISAGLRAAWTQHPHQESADGISAGLRAAWTQHPHQESAGGISAGLCAVWTSHQDTTRAAPTPARIGGRNLGRIACRMDTTPAPRIGGRNLGRIACRMDTTPAPRMRTESLRAAWTQHPHQESPGAGRRSWRSAGRSRVTHWLRRSGRCRGPWPLAATRR